MSAAVAHDRRAAEAYALEHAWLTPDPALAIAERFPNAAAGELKRLIAIAEQRVAEEFDFSAAGNAADQEGDAEPHASPLTEGQAKHLAAFEADEAAAGERARALMDFAGGLEDAGHAETARRCRMVGRDVLELLPKLAEERSARLAMQLARNRLQDIVDKRGDS